MTQEEKAKRYDEVLEQAKSWYVDAQLDFKKSLETLLPELKEPEDEKIRKELIDYHRSMAAQADDYVHEAWIAWLEKQGEQKPTLRERYKNIAESEWFKKTHEGMSISDEEVNNVNNVEPKFKVGDWISNSACTIQITSIDDKYYWHDNNHVGGDIESIDKQYHLWTIEDTKEGDVLAEDPIFECPSSFVAIYKKQNEEDFDSYCFVGFNGKFYEGECGHSTEYIHPATKEQRDLLFQKMKEAGYEWDAEKKELKKIEDEEYNGEDYGIDSLYHAQRILEKTLGKVDGYQTDDGILSHKCAITAVKKLYKQKPAWSEEDKKILDALITSLINERFAGRLEFLKGIKVSSVIDWLKTLKEKIKKETV